jgi:CheY-like chemotaxis protein
MQNYAGFHGNRLGNRSGFKSLRSLHFSRENGRSLNFCHGSAPGFSEPLSFCLPRFRRANLTEFKRVRLNARRFQTDSPGKRAARISTARNNPAGPRCRSFSRLLRAAGFQPVAYPSAEAFLEDLKHPRFDGLVFDIQLEGMSGLELSQRLTAVRNRTPIIFITAYDEPETRRQAEALGCAGYFSKADPGQVIIDDVRHRHRIHLRLGELSVDGAARRECQPVTEDRQTAGAVQPGREILRRQTHWRS